MIDYKKISLVNGLRILVHEDHSTPLVAMNILYDVGSKDEDPGLTGIAHLFEHLMFSGSINIADYDTPLQLAGGENNAFTNNDITSYFLTIPSQNIETAFWLESDRMLGLDITEKNLGVQKSVVIEEFKQRYLNQPYGDSMMLLRSLAYRKHPYRWTTIGKNISHIRNVNLEKIREFFFSHYAPNNSILTLTGNIETKRAFALADKWFGPVKPRKLADRNLPQEPPQKKDRNLSVERKVPSDMIYKAWRTCRRSDSEFYILDLITDILAGGESGRLYDSLVRDKRVFSDINAYLTGEIDPGLLIINGKTMPGTDIEKADSEISKIVEELKLKPVPDKEMEKVKNKFEATMVLTNTNILNKAMNLSLHELLGNADTVNKEVELYRSVTADMVSGTSKKYLQPEKCNTLYYKSVK